MLPYCSGARPPREHTASTHEVKLAVQECLDGASPTDIANKYTIPRPTLSGRVQAAKRGKPKRDKAGAPTLLTAENEIKLRQYIVESAENGAGLTPQTIYIAAKELGDKQSPKAVFTGAGGLPGKSWCVHSSTDLALIGSIRWKGFRKRHDLTTKKPRKLNAERAKQTTPEIVTGFLLQLGAVIALCMKVRVVCLRSCICSLLFLQEAADMGVDFTDANVLNFDESAIVALDLARIAFACAVGTSTLRAVCNDWFSKHLTVGITIAADGSSYAPLFIMSGKTYSSNWLDGAIDGSVLAMSPKGSIDRDIFLAYVKHLASVIKRRPLILLIDNHTSRYSLEVSQVFA